MPAGTAAGRSGAGGGGRSNGSECVTRLSERSVRHWREPRPPRRRRVPRRYRGRPSARQSAKRAASPPHPGDGPCVQPDPCGDDSLVEYRVHWPAWGERWDSNPRHPGPQPGALPTELRPPPEGLGMWRIGLAASTRRASRQRVGLRQTFLGQLRTRVATCRPAERHHLTPGRSAGTGFLQGSAALRSPAPSSLQSQEVPPRSPEPPDGHLGCPRILALGSRAAHLHH